jgi:hypothetical protein
MEILAGSNNMIVDLVKKEAGTLLYSILFTLPLLERE